MDKVITELDQVLFNYDLEHWGLILLGDLNVDYNASNRTPRDANFRNLHLNLILHK